MIYFDSEFNCRDAFTPDSVKELADSIKGIGLQTPIVVQPASEADFIPKGFDYRLVAGHRRFIACTVFLKWSTIPATIRHDLKENARQFNLKENIDRQALNPVEEAKAVRAIYGDATDADISHALGRSTQWVANRRRILMLPTALQAKVAIGLLTMDEVKVISGYADAETQMTIARKILRAKVGGKTKTHKQITKQRQKTVRARSEIQRMIDRLTRLRLDGFATRLLAWAAGWVTDADIDKDVQKVFRHHNPDIP